VIPDVQRDAGRVQNTTTGRLRNNIYQQEVIWRKHCECFPLCACSYVNRTQMKRTVFWGVSPCSLVELSDVSEGQSASVFIVVE
jgi:hypothetical protein